MKPSGVARDGRKPPIVKRDPRAFFYSGLHQLDGLVAMPGETRAAENRYPSD
ncbi:MAG: hypothetical protein KUF74_08560 [Candidatus Thiodiazotropha sp. (ex Ctena orbiculata)]|nr:hypothetical protein [Candidatus Thiodiazotropha taylori]